MEWGSVAEIVSAAATVVALAAAIVAAWQAIRTNDQQGRQLAKLEDAETDRARQAERADANRVAFWPGLRPDAPTSPFIYYANTSGLPVYELTLRITVPERSEPIEIAYHSFSPESHHRPMNRTRRALETHHREHNSINWGRALADDEFRCSATFRDTAGRWWLRTDAGELRGPATSARDVSALLQPT